jgi:uncharacterized protein
MTNSLAGETSPYLRQHAHNPVDWLPWGPEALQRAQHEGKPILLSIGYAACHWCHVMAHESFEDPATATLMNQLYINIKVDREERPDIDRLYQLAQQMLTGRGGGWPLTMFLLPDNQRPFFGGTYFPPAARHGLPAFRDLLQHVEHYFREHASELQHSATQVVEALERIKESTPADEPLSTAPIAACRATLQRIFEPEWGGFGSAPKFPHPPFLTRLLRDWYASADEQQPDLQALYLATLTLTRMAEGGLFDQLGGGFYRYSVDERWEIPHFEKMLYDNAQLLAIYADAAAATGEPLFREVAERTADWLLGEMRAPTGAFYSSLDADSEGHEGKYYVWQREEVRALLSDAEYEVFALRYALHQPANFEGHWHLKVNAPLSNEADGKLIASATDKLLAVRTQRVRPGLDDKILTSWNALTIRGLAIAARQLNRSDYAEAASTALSWLRAHHWRDGRLLATSAGGAAHLNAYLDDYVYLAEAILELSMVRFNAAELRFGCELLDVVLQNFSDAERGGFYFTSADHEQLISRPKNFSDDAIPSGNGIAAIVLQRYGLLLGETRYLDAAERTLRCAWSEISEHSTQYATLLQALEEFVQPPDIVILRGEPAAIAEWHAQLNAQYAPRRLVLAIPADATDLPEALSSKPARGAAVAYLCRGMTCLEPFESLSGLTAELHS